MKSLENIPNCLSSLKDPVLSLYSIGNEKLLQTPMISIVGTRRPIAYTKEMTRKLSTAFSNIGYTIVSGAAMGVDAIAQEGALPTTIAVMANGLDIIYPKVNQKLISNIHTKGLVLSEYDKGVRATKYSFVVRNRIVVALGEALIITEADENSGTMRSADIAKALGKPIYVLSHRVGQSLGTQKLLDEGSAELISNIDQFVAKFGMVDNPEDDEIKTFFSAIPTLNEALERYGESIYEFELEGLIEIKNLKVYPL